MQSVQLLIYVLLFMYLKLINTQYSYKSNEVLLRKKRYLTFPDGSNFIMTASAIKSLLITYPPGFLSIIELDVVFKLPPKSEKKKIKKYFYHFRHRRDLYRQISRAVEMYGYNGDSCIKRLLCEVQNFAPENSLFQQLIVTIFSNKLNNNDCNNNEQCNLSLLNIILHHIYMQSNV